LFSYFPFCVLPSKSHVYIFVPGFEKGRLENKERQTKVTLRQEGFGVKRISYFMKMIYNRVGRK
jgi:hypothetical protein